MTPPMPTSPTPVVALPKAAADAVTEVLSSRWPGAAVVRTSPLRQDASSRRYVRVDLEGPASAPPSLVVMLMEDASVALSSQELGVYGESGPCELPFVNVARFLAAIGAAVPEIYAVAADSTAIVLEDVGDISLWEAARTAGSDPEELFGRALDDLADMQARAVASAGSCQAFDQAFDERLFAWEFEHFLEYGIAPQAPEALVRTARGELERLARELAALPRVFTHRDYHAWNIHYRDGRLRIIDFQDALLAPALYDVASLLTDRITPQLIDPARRQRLVRRFWQRQSAGRLSSWEDTDRAWTALALQRVLKVVGRFNYLADVKGKPAYREMLPAVVATARELVAAADSVPATGELLATEVRDGGATRP